MVELTLNQLCKKEFVYTLKAKKSKYLKISKKSKSKTTHPTKIGEIKYMHDKEALNYSKIK
jgi:hypothetical protein